MKNSNRLLLILLWSGLCNSSLYAAETLIAPFTSNWKYLDDGSNQGTAWRGESFDDSSWDSGLAILGYGDGDISTTVNSGPVNDHYITTYFRHTFNVADIASYQSLIIDAYRDDGFVVYLNGTEIWRNNIPTGEIHYETLASTAISGSAERSPASTIVSSSALQNDNNVLAVEIHQVAATSTDIAFALQLQADTYPPPNPEVTRGPYLQMITPTSATIRWRTPIDTNSNVNYGTSSSSLNNSQSDLIEKTEHAIQLENLLPDTIYFYDIGTTTTVLSSGNDGIYQAPHFFKTQPAVGSTSPARIWVIGDSGTGSQDQKNVFAGYQKYAGSTYTDVWLMMGDNAYINGTDSEYQAGFFNIYQNMLHQTVVWPTLGNHDGYSVDTDTGTGPYYDIFTLPQNDEMGGYPSGTESYYSYNYGNIHFIVLDSFDMDRSIAAPMAIWLQNDLNNTTADWIIAYWHHSPYSKGSHDSDTSDGQDGSSTGIDSLNAMIQMRENILPILEQHGVDLVLTGHSHSYERSKFINCHYDLSPTYSDISHALNSGSGDIHNSATVYSKAHPALLRNPDDCENDIPMSGTVYAVVGTSASVGGGTYDHPVMYRSLPSLGSMVIDVQHLSLSARFINEHGVILDAFNMQKLVSGPDEDGDGINNGSDNCPQNANTDQLNADGDGFGNLCDSDWFDSDLDGTGNNMDWDDDGDGAPDVVDAEPLNGSNDVEIPLPLNAIYKGNRLNSSKTAAP